ncbi:hypothetical protein CF319_g1232 [Tilletia indica]|nr:hypothetical protein CF319_g1232 [Tilletia indica]
MPTTPMKHPFLQGDSFSSPALTSPADDPPDRPLKAHDVDADGDCTLDSIDEDDDAADKEAAEEDKKERVKDTDYEDDPSHSLSSPIKDNHNIPSSPSISADLMSSPVLTQMSAKETRASQLAQIRAAKKARDMVASARGSPAPSASSRNTPQPSGSTVVSVNNAEPQKEGRTTRKRKASADDKEVAKRQKGEVKSSAGKAKSRDVSPVSSLSSLSDADAEGSEIEDGAEQVPVPAASAAVPTPEPTQKEAQPSLPPTKPSPPPAASPSLADAFAAARNEDSASSSKLPPEPRVNPEVERTRARRLQSLWPDRSLDHCIEALRRSDWNVTAAMEWLESVKPEATAAKPVLTKGNGAATGGRTGGQNGNGHPVVPSQAAPPKPASGGKRPIPRGAIILGGAKKDASAPSGSRSVFVPPPNGYVPFTPVRAEDISPAARAAALRELSDRGTSTESSQELATPPTIPSSSKSSAGPTRPPSIQAKPSLAASALQARRAAEEAERARAQEAKKLAKARRKAEEEEAMAALEDADDVGSGMDEAEREAMQERTALEWFNTCDETALLDTIGCNAAQAAGIVAMRPFKSVADVNTRLGDKKVKGVTPRLFHNCIELMAGYHEVDTILAKCEKVGRMLQDAMADWDPEYLHQIGGGMATAAGSRAGTPLPSGSGSVKAQTPVPTAAPSPSPAVAGGETEGGAEQKQRSVVADGKRKAWLSEQPAGMAPGVVLKNYQLAGLNWLSLLYERKTSCILADEMGLGKTVQVISFFAHIKALGIPGPHLVVVPSSVLENWMREFRTFAPDLIILKYYGNQREREDLRIDLRDSNDFDVMLTTYDMAAGGPNDHAFLRKRGFDACVFDEGHVLKSRKSQKYEKLMRIRASWRLLLTGTPLQNNLQELVSLLNFIMPAYFSSAEEALSAIFKVKTSAQKNELSQQRIVRAKKMMHPFVLRRRKDKVLTELMSKTERTEYCDMTRVQKKLYNEALSRTRAALMEQDNSTQTRSSVAKKKASTSSSHVLMDLRKAANHPLLFRTIYTDAKIAAFAKDYIQEPDNADENIEHVKQDFAINSDAQLSFTANAWPCTRKHILPSHEWMNSGKVKALQRLLQTIKAQGDRAIIFSQFTTVLDILCVCLDIMGIKFVGFTGQTEVGDRQHLVDQFTNDTEISVFLLSTKAGGLGINLVAANWVILFDQDFNPQNDKQAADRAYRIGQTKEVHVVRLISKGTIDEDIFRLGQRKLELENRVAGGSGGAGGDDAEEGDEDDMEQKVQRSLLTQLRDRVEDDAEEGEGGEGEANGAVEGVGT